MTTKSNNKSIVLGEHLSSFVTAQVASGQFSNASEVVRAGLRLLEERETKLAALRAALEEGERSPVAEDFSLENVLKRVNQTPR